LSSECKGPIHIGLFGVSDEIIQIIAQWCYFANTPMRFFGVIPDGIVHQQAVQITRFINVVAACKSSGIYWPFRGIMGSLLILYNLVSG
jgi:hypothetical protein